MNKISKVIAIVVIFLGGSVCMGQQARPTYNPFATPQYGIRPFPNTYAYGMQNNYGMQRPNNNYGMHQFFQQPQIPNNTNYSMNFNRPNNFGFQNNWQQQPQVQPQLFFRKFHLNNGYLLGRPRLWYDPKSNKMQPWIRKNLR